MGQDERMVVLFCLRSFDQLRMLTWYSTTKFCWCGWATASQGLSSMKNILYIQQKENEHLIKSCKSIHGF